MNRPAVEKSRQILPLISVGGNEGSLQWPFSNGTVEGDAQVASERPRYLACSHTEERIGMSRIRSRCMAGCHDSPGLQMPRELAAHPRTLRKRER
jgi:hypothetical protein